RRSRRLADPSNSMATASAGLQGFADELRAAFDPVAHIAAIASHDIRFDASTGALADLVNEGCGGPGVPAGDVLSSFDGMLVDPCVAARSRQRPRAAHSSPSCGPAGCSCAGCRP